MKIKRAISNTLKTLILPAFVYLLFLTLSGGRFGSWKSMTTIFRQAVYPCIIAWAICNGQTMGVFDFSPGAIITLAGIVGGGLATQWNAGPWWMAVFIIAVSVICCMLVCTVFTFCKIPSMIVSLGMLMVFESLGAYLFDGAGATIARGWTFFGKSPWVFMIAIAVFAVIYVTNKFTKFGYDVRSLGNGLQIARNIGVKVVQTRYKAFLLQGILLGVAAVVNIATQGSAKPVTGMATTSIAFSAIMAFMVGSYLSKYCDLLVGTMMGALTLKMLASGMLAIGLMAEAQQIGNGVFLIVFLAISQNQGLVFELRNRWKRRKEIVGNEP